MTALDQQQQPHTTRSGQPWLRAGWLERLISSRWLFLGLLLLLAALPRLFWLDAQSLWLDEGSTWQMTRQTTGALLLDLFNPVSAYPLYHLLLKGWLALAGDSEWALRLPSALAGAGAVVALYAAAHEVQQWDSRAGGRFFPLAAALLLTFSPYAIWYAQEAKVYSLLLLVTVLLLWSLLRALRQPGRGAWLLVGGLALVSIFVHRLAVLLLLAAWVAWLLTVPAAQRLRRRWLRVLTGWWGVALVGAGVVAAMAYGLASDLAATGAAIPAGPGWALWLTFVRFSLDRGPGEFPWWWLLPWLLLALWGGGLLLRDSWQAAGGRRQVARVLLCLLLVPLALFVLQLAFTRFYEARYLIVVYPAWLLLLAYPLAWPQAGRLPSLAAGAALGLALLSSGAALLQPPQGIFSGHPVKEQYREAFGVLARQVHPDDAVVLHPAYVRPLYDYYMQRWSADPAPEPITFPAFKHRQQFFNQRDWDEARRQRLAGYVRSFLVLAPEHARTVDRPQQGDEYGLVGLWWLYSGRLDKWPCGIWRANGVHVLCQDSPEAYETGREPRPQTRQPAQFGQHIQLQGYTLKATTPAGPGTYRAGGTLPLTLFWEVTQQPAEQYSVFLHLCRDCDQPPAASADGTPLQGYLPTSVWTPDNPVHDERAIVLPPDLPPGRYQLLLGVYPAHNPAEAARLPVQSQPEHMLPAERLLLTTVEVTGPTS